MTLISDFAADLRCIMDPNTGLGETILLDNQSVNALVQYGTDTDENGAKMDIMDLDLFCADSTVPPAYRTEAVVNNVTWYYWKQIFRDVVSAKLRFVKNPRFKFNARDQSHA